jgi:two-component system, response regulator PdtaR
MLDRTGRKPVVLVVEDDALLRLDAVETVKEAGFEVIEAADAEAAIAHLRTRQDIAVVFTDIELPGSMDGLMLVAAIRDRWPPIKVIAASGRFGCDDERLPTGEPLLVKPYSSHVLKSAISDLVGQR